MVTRQVQGLVEALKLFLQCKNGQYQPDLRTDDPER